MRKHLLLGFSGAALLCVAPINTSFAQAADTPQPPPKSDARPAPQTADKAGAADNQIANDVDARIAVLKAELRLSPDQESNWSGLQTALHDYGIGEYKMIGGRTAYADHDEQKRDERPNDIASMRNEAAAFNMKADSLKKIAGAAEPLYGSLDERQKHRLIQFIRAQTEYERR